MMNIIALLIYYVFGLIGAWLGLSTVLFSIDAYIRSKHLNNRSNAKTNLDRWILELNDRLGIDWESFNVLDFRMSLRTAFWCGIYATLGPYACVISFITGLIMYFTFIIIQNIHNK